MKTHTGPIANHAFIVVATAVVVVVALTSSAEAKAPSSALGTKLYGQLSSKPGNLVVSPASARTALGIARAGAGGVTRAQIEALIGKGPVPSSGDSVVVVGTGVALTDAFKKEAQTSFHALVTDPAHMADVEKILGPAVKGVSTDGVIMGNALHFKGTWLTQFQPTDTADLPFFLDEKLKKDVPTMYVHTLLRAKRTADVDVVSLPYKDRSSMLVVVPRKTLAAVEAKLDVAQLSAGLRKQDVQVRLPRFSIESTLELDGAMAALGMKNASCTALPKVDFTKLGTADGPLCIDEMRQVASIEVDEKGTTAAAASVIHAAVAEGEPEGPQPLEINADRPFLFFVEDAAGDVTFMGRMADPAPAAPSSPIAPAPKRD